MFDRATLSLYKRLLKYILPYKGMIAITVCALFIIASMDAAFAMVFKELVDESLIAKNPDSFIFIPLLLALVVTVKGFAEYASKVFSKWIAEKAILNIRADMYQKMHHLPFFQFQSYGTGNLLSKITYDVPQTSNALSTAWVTIIRDSLTVLVLLAYLLYISWQLTLIMLVIGPIVAFIIDRASKLMRGSSKAMQKNMGQLTHRLEESLTAHQEIKIYGAEDYEKTRFQNTATELMNNTMKVTKVSALNVPLVQVLAAIALAIVVYIAMQMAANEMFTPGELIAYIIAMGLIFEPIRRLTSVNEVVQKGMAAAESIFELLDQKDEIDKGQQPPQINQYTLEFNNLNFNYPLSDKQALKALNLTIEAGKTTALVGQSGSGKSTLVNLITRFYEPTDGEILLDNTNINEINRQYLRQKIAMVSQKVTLFDDTIAANIAYGHTEFDRDKIIQAAKDAHAWEFIEKLPEGLDTRVGENGSQLSGGQRQRIAIARAFLKDAPILIFDEATSALDNHSEKMIQNAMQSLRHNRTVIIIAHRLTTIENADNIVVMDQGSIIEQGSHNALIEQNGHYAQLYNQSTLNND